MIKFSTYFAEENLLRAFVVLMKRLEILILLKGRDFLEFEHSSTLVFQGML